MIFSPPLWGGGGPQPAGGAPFLCRPGQALPRAAGRAPPPFSAPGRRRKPGLAAARDQPKENHGRAPDRGPPPPRRPGDGGPRRGEVELGAGGARAQARPPTPRPGGRSQRPGHRHHGRAPPAGGCRPPVFGRPATRPDAGRPRAGGPAASHQPTPTAARAHGPGPDKAGLVAIGAGAAGPGQYRPGLHPTGRIPFMFAPAGQTAPQGREPRTGTAGRRALRPAAWRHGRREVRTEAGAIPPGRGAAWRQKNAGRLAPPPAGHDWTKKMRGGRFVPPACRYSGYQISPCSA